MTISAKSGLLTLYIEGFGNEDGLYRMVHNAGLISTIVPNLTPTDVYIDGLLGWPAEVERGIDPLTFAPQVGAVDYSLARTPLTLDALWNQRAPITLGTGGPYSASATTLSFTGGSHADLQGTVIYWQREVIIVGTLASTVSGVSTYITCQRGALYSTAQAQMSGLRPDPEVYSSLSETLRGRLVTLGFLPSTALGVYDEQVLHTAVLWDLTAPHAGEFVLSCRPLWSLVQGARVGRGLWSVANARARNLTRPAAGYLSASEDTQLLMTLRGEKRVQIEAWRGAATFGVTTISTQGQTIFNPDRVPLGPDDRLTEVLSTHPLAPSNSATPGPDTLPLSQSPGVLVLQLLTSTDNNGVSGVNGDYDLGIGAAGGALPVAILAVDEIVEAFSRQAAPLIDNLFIYEERPLEDLLVDIARTANLAWTQKNAQLTVVPIADIERYGQVTPTVVAGQILSTGITHDRRLGGTISQARATFAQRPGQEPFEVVSRGAWRRARNPPASDEEASFNIDFIGRDRVAIDLVSDAVERHSRAPVQITIQTLRTVEVGVGDVIRLTAPSVISGGALGVVDGRYRVMSVRSSVDGEQDVQTLLLLDVGAIYDRRVAWIAPSARVKSWDGGTLELEVYESVFGGQDIPEDAGAFAAGDVLQLTDQYGTTKASSLVVASVVGDVITLTGTPAATPADGDILRLAVWSSQTTTQREDWCSVAPDAGLGGDTANDYSYTGG
jgi:hypothetical protein